MQSCQAQIAVGVWFFVFYHGRNLSSYLDSVKIEYYLDAVQIIKSHKIAVKTGNSDELPDL